MSYFFLFIAVVSILLTSIISLIPLGWVSQGDISDMYITSITPAGFTFSIWSIIYISWILLGLYSIYYNKWWKKYLLLAGSIFLSVIWLLPWHYDIIWLSLVIMAGIFWSLVYIFLRKAYKDKYFQYTLELYLWWILVAFIANIHIFLVSVNIYTFPIFFTFVSFIIWLTLLSYSINTHKSFIPSYVFLWALFGIYTNQNNTLIEVWAIISALILVTIIARKHPQTSHIFR